MQEKVISIIPVATPAAARQAPAIPVADRLARPLRDLRISVTDRCNLRCVYCMPKQVFGRDFQFIPHSEMLSFEEISRLAGIFVNLGVEKIRLTGGEPLMRRHVENLVEQLAMLKTPDGHDIDLTLTTNGALLAKKARSLYDAGLKRITVSLDALDDRVFRRMNDVDFPVAQVLAGIEAAQSAGFSPLKVNTVVKKGMNEQEILPIARHFRHTGIIPRFIEYMDAGNTNGWLSDEIVPSDTLVSLIHAEIPLEPLSPNYPGETASRWRYRDGSGEIGVIASVTQAFCGDCTRIRMSTTGRLYTCLFATAGFDLKPLIRDGWSDEQLAHVLARHWQNRENRYSELRNTRTAMPGQKVEMSYIGG
ncbi:GTP 3',8-cyclase MoaA [Oxalobacter vibrioformis]|uniref:GTP 3',8-cyclase n=1 Tax=Oxalobacter vibrioformis TaxID=933080 RepID=A0A9E9P2M1_9BURK|nr:GTP 3',8-cyclase MoaA [Oxalobacter vibrioformis]WAW10047.1 GTP 3',8-cyclase MoaA [Oxalobacter vibrioformis]